MRTSARERAVVLRLRWILVWAVMGIGCGVLSCASGPAPRDHFYRFHVARETASAGACRLPGTLRVERFESDALTSGRPVVYQQDANSPELGRYAFQLWAGPPSELLNQEFVAYLAGRKVASEVLGPGARVPADYIARGRVLKLQHTLAPVATAVLELQLTLVDQKNRKVLVNETYSATQPAEDVGAAADAFGQEAQGIFARFVADCAQRLGGGAAAE